MARRSFGLSCSLLLALSAVARAEPASKAADPALPPVVISTPDAVTVESGEGTPKPAGTVDFWKDDIMDADEQAIQILLANPFVDFEPSRDASRKFERESKGKYHSSREKLKACKGIPIDFIWNEFAPFFQYTWNRQFRSFAALLLAIWKRETAFTPPAQGVHVNPNCKDKRAKIVRPLPGLSLRQDLRTAHAKDTVLSAWFKGCSLRIADFGPLQWNHRWRLTGKEFRADIERALLLTTHYPEARLQKLRANEIASLVKYNPKALFLLGGLSLRDGAANPQRTIDGYNTDPGYRAEVAQSRRDILRTLESDPACSPLSTGKR